MNEKRASLEVIAMSVEEAIDKGLADLGLGRDEVEVKILDEGSRGLFGLGSRQARIRLTLKSEVEPLRVASTEDEIIKVEPPAAKPESSALVTAPAKTIEDEYILETCRATIEELLEKMRVQATVTVKYGETDEVRNRTPLLVSVNGDDLSVLIGRRAETLNAFQYIASLIVSKEVGHLTPLVVDVEGYRARRESQLRQLARGLADQAIKTGRRQVLEPMPANERRIIHIELRDNPQVTTESIGEEPRRKVTIMPK